MAGLHKNGAKLSKGVPFVLRQERLSVFAQDYEESPLELFMRYLGVVPRQEIEIYERGAPKHKKGECKRNCFDRFSDPTDPTQMCSGHGKCDCQNNNNGETCKVQK